MLLLVWLHPTTGKLLVRLMSVCVLKSKNAQNIKTTNIV